LPLVQKDTDQIAAIRCALNDVAYRDPKTGAIDLNALRREADRLANLPAEEVRNVATRRDRRATGRKLRAAQATLEQMEI